jgi:hypothetical protein
MASSVRPEWAGWLPTPVQALANVAWCELRLVPLVQDDVDDQSVSLRRPTDDVEVGLLAECGDVVTLFVPDPAAVDGCPEIVGEAAIVAAFHRYAATGSLLPVE